MRAVNVAKLLGMLLGSARLQLLPLVPRYRHGAEAKEETRPVCVCVHNFFFQCKSCTGACMHCLDCRVASEMSPE